MSTDVLALNAQLRERIERNLARFERRPLNSDHLRAAAVALVITDDEAGRASFILTRRAERLSSHAGQWALPGGRLDAGEGAEEAALRELDEEVGLRLTAESILGILDDYETRSGYVITPVVVWGGATCELVPNMDEVASVHRVGLEELSQEGVPVVRAIPESDRPTISIPLLGNLIHAPTAALLYQLSEVAIWGRKTRVADYEQPVFAWK